MKRLIALLILGLAAISMPLGAADDVARKPAAAKPAAAGKSLDPVKGPFHQVHAKKLQLGCASCHASEQQDILFLRKDDAPTPDMPGQVNREVCLSCHKAPAKPAWYGATRR